MMDMSKKIFAVDDVSLHDLEEHLNELAADDWVLHSIYQIGGDSSLPYFTVITYRPYDWAAHFEKNKEKWEITMKHIPMNGMAVYPLGVKKDLKQDYPNYGFYQEGL